MNRPRRIQVDEAGLLNCPHCGCLLDDTRSLKHHNALFAFVGAAFKNWPESFTAWPQEYEQFSPHNPDHLRAWLECQSGFIRPPRTYLASTRKELTMQIEIMKADVAADTREGLRYRLVNPLGGGNGFEIITPASLAWDKLGQAKFADVSGKISGIVQDITGFGFDEWKQGAWRK